MKRLISFLLLACASLFAANATPVSISSIAVSGSTVTVNTGATHNLSAAGNGQGFCIAGSGTSADNVCGVVATAPTSTQLTFTMSGLAACSTSCGTIAPAPQIIVLKATPLNGEMTMYTYLLWLTTQKPCPGPSSSSWTAASNSGSAGSTSAQNTAISQGWFVEQARTTQVPVGTAIATLQGLLQSDYTQQQAALANNPQPCIYYGQNFDGTGWAQK